ncbi:hypothetical protein [Paenibacillus sp. Y412MC10]|uniref:hypothetical protein n=1 Tax=Geobacillus sp. (strain Y412MC10) TaxID=481743 RepID=UPI0016428A1D|nr:hypothetical protein [Paenibacillus sp. Y412MC10]
MKKVTIQPAPHNLEEVLERITDSGHAVFTSPVESEEEFAKIQESVKAFIRRDKESQKQ